MCSTGSWAPSTSTSRGLVRCVISWPLWSLLRTLADRQTTGPLSVRPLTKRFGPLGWCGRWDEHGLVLSSAVGKPLDAANVRRAFRQALKDVDGIDADEWTPRELRHSFVSLLSDRGVPLEVISRLVGHSGTAVTEEVYRKQIRPVIQTGAVVMDGIFGAEEWRP